MSVQPFHLAIPVDDLTKAKAFYGELLGCEMGRFSNQWIDWNFFGHQLVTHLVVSMPSAPQHNEVDSHAVPVPHFGVVLQWDDWQALSQRLKAAGTEFVIEPYIRFKGQAGEQATLFFMDPAGNALEFKAFKDIDQLFAR
ncbi:VOC family protein [Bowmanella dokdonensis]|uniref:VOC family protein n=1 Tax=Bowmanella dokdonensis TaxID=751969 RepID=A0A939DMI3_9ALTE|nr:VOC family protein [Bowmanella dokdonensis]MBN7825218.1 VOC family protein [Bowmanella dokdonensis]